MIGILFIGTMALSLWAAWRAKSVYARYNQGVVRSGLTGAEVAALGVAAHEAGHAITLAPPFGAGARVRENQQLN